MCRCLEKTIDLAELVVFGMRQVRCGGSLVSLPLALSGTLLLSSLLSLQQPTGGPNVGLHFSSKRMCNLTCLVLLIFASSPIGVAQRKDGYSLNFPAHLFHEQGLYSWFDKP